jgi:hypothetical protein
VSDTLQTIPYGVVPLTEDDYLETSNCTYHSIWQPHVQEHFKAGLLLCPEGSNIEHGDKLSRVENTGRDMQLIPCETGLNHYRSTGENRWRLREEKLVPANYVHLAWGTEHLFCTNKSKAIQLKVVWEAASQTPTLKKAKSEPDVGPAPAKKEPIIDLTALLHEMKLASNAL